MDNRYKCFKHKENIRTPKNIIPNNQIVNGLCYAMLLRIAMLLKPIDRIFIQVLEPVAGLSDVQHSVQVCFIKTLFDVPNIVWSTKHSTYHIVSYNILLCQT